ncbi:MAG: cohesin domain-containing protein [bacterium]|nr:cohesin domain-containing protein [bacterium]
MKKLYIFASFLMAFGLVLLPSRVLAASANFYVSPSSSSLTKGNTVTLKVRISSGSNRVDTAQAKLTFDSSRLQYVSYSGGAFTEFSKSSTSSSVTYVGVKYGSYTTGDQILFSVTLKSIKSGTASLSLSGVQAAYAGSNLSVSASGGSVKVSDPVSSTPKTPSSSGTVIKTPATETSVESDTAGPKLKGEPNIEKTESTITMQFKTDEKSNGSMTYGLENSKGRQKIEFSELKTEHEVRIGNDQPLQPGTTYNLNLVLRDAAGNTSTKSFIVRTKGVVYKVKVVDAAGQPLKNHPVELHSDPIKATTDENGIATFEDVTPGEHTLVFNIDGIIVRNPVHVGSVVMPLENNDNTSTVTLPFRLGAVTPQKNQNPLPWLAGGLVVGILLIKLPLRRIFSNIAAKAKNKIAKSKKPKLPQNHAA